MALPLSVLPELPGHYTRAVSVVKDVVFPLCKALYIGRAGTLSFVAADGNSALIIPPVPDGTLLPIRAIVVVSASSADNILALY